MTLLLSRLASPIGTLLLVTDGEALCALGFLDHEWRLHRDLRRRHGAYALTPTSDAGEPARRLEAYFAGEINRLDEIAVRPGGTEFQRLVWAALRRIPAGSTTTYGRLAASLGKAKASRAVGLANGANPVAIVVPCHRLVGADDGLTGYGGGLPRKAWLLAHERRHAPPAAGRAEFIAGLVS